jgi:O-antigen/teichoic acid export membrane protein
MNKNILLAIIIALAVHVLLLCMISYKKIPDEEGLKKKFVLASIGIAIIAIIGSFVGIFMMGGSNSNNQGSPLPIPSPSPTPAPGPIVESLKNKNRVN